MLCFIHIFRRLSLPYMHYAVLLKPTPLCQYKDQSWYIVVKLLIHGFGNHQSFWGFCEIRFLKKSMRWGEAWGILPYIRMGSSWFQNGHFNVLTFFGSNNWGFWSEDCKKIIAFLPPWNIWAPPYMLGKISRVNKVVEFWQRSTGKRKHLRYWQESFSVGEKVYDVS